MRRLIAFWAEIPQSYIDEVKASRSWRVGQRIVISILCAYFVLHFCFLYVFDPESYPRFWLHIVDAVQAYVPGAVNWGISSRLLWDQMPSLHALGFICGISIFLITAFFSPGMPFFVRTEDGSVSTRSFFHSLIVALGLIALNVYWLFFFWNGKDGPLESLEGVGYQLRNLLESRFGNLLGLPMSTGFSYYFPGAVIAWLRMVMVYRFILKRNKK